MRIAIITMFREGYGGGCGRVAHDMARHFGTAHDILLIGPADKTQQSQVTASLSVLGIDSSGEGNMTVPILTRRNVNAMFDALKAFGPAVVHAHEPIGLGLLGQVWAALNRVPFAYTAHVLPTKTLDFGATDTLKFLDNAWTASVTQRMMSDFLHNCDAVIALNEAAAADLRQFGYQGKLVTIPNARDLERLGACATADPSLPTRTLTFVGSITPRKNQHYLVEVLLHLPRHYVMLFVGDALDPAYGRYIRQWSRANNLENAIFTGPVPYAEIPEYLSKTHVFCSASKMEVQSLAIIEALGSGTPVVALSNETTDQLVDEQVGAWLAQDTRPEVFAQRVRAICELPPDEYAQLCANARQRVRHLDWPSIREQTVAAYQALIEANESARPSDAPIARALDLLPSVELRQILMERMARINKSLLHRAQSHSGVGIGSMATSGRQVSSKTWFFVQVTRLASFIAGGGVEVTTRVGHALRRLRERFAK